MYRVTNPNHRSNLVVCRLPIATSLNFDALCGSYIYSQRKLH